MIEPIPIPEKKGSELISRLSKSLMDQHNFQLGKISGDAILRFSAHQQINQFLKFQIYQDWNSQMSRLKHPYFDFDNPEVRASIQKVMNVLSRHISVSKEDFQPLLEKAVFNTFRLILNPVESMSKFYFPGTDRIPLELFIKHAHYFSDFDFVIQAIRKYYEKNGIKVVEKDQFFQLFNKVVSVFETREKKSIQEYQEYLFKKAFGRDLNEFLDKAPNGNESSESNFAFREKPSEYSTNPQESKVSENPIAPVTESAKHIVAEPEPEIKPEPFVSEEPTSESVEVIEEKPIFEPEVRDENVNINEEELEEEVYYPPVNEEIMEPEPEVRIQEPEYTAPPFEPAFEVTEPEMNPEIESELVEEAPVEEEPVMELRKEDHQPKMEELSDDQPLDLFSKSVNPSQVVEGKEPQTLAEKLQSQSQPGNLADSFSAGQKHNLSKIPVHQQFQYIQQLFGGSSVKYKVVIEKLESCNSFGEADQILDRYVFNTADVNKNSSAAKEFVEIVKQNF